MTAAAPLPRLPLIAPPAHRDPLSATARCILLAAALGAHLLGAWALLQIPAVGRMAVEVAPIRVDLIAPQPEAPRPAPRPPPSSPPPAQPALPAKAPTTTPVLAAKPPPLPSAPPVFTAPPPLDLPAPSAPAALPPQPAPPAPPAPAAPPAPLAAPASAPAAPKAVLIGETDWVRAPQLEYPLASKRLREAGVVQVRALIDARGVPRRVVLHRSSGFPRLDQEALEKALSARLKPRTENGQPLEFWALMPFGFELEN